jgi:hypothetical protein
MSHSMTIHRRIHFCRSGHRRVLREGRKPHPKGRVPRVSKLMALAIHLEQLVSSGEVQNYASLASVGNVTRSRITQIINLPLLAPDIQEAILFLPRVQRGRDSITERDLRPIVAEPDWQKQRSMWGALQGELQTGNSV